MKSVLNLRGVEKTYYTGFFRKKTRALKGVDLEVYENELIGFLGPNGAGKTTTIKIMLGIVFPSAGGGEILGKPLGDVAIKNRIGFLPEAPYFYDYLKGREFLDFYGRLHGLRGAERKKRVEELTELVGVAHAADLPLRKYSKGMLQRIGMAQALIGDPELVILDEPMSGLDPLGRRDMREIILNLKDRGKTVFLSSHILPDVEQICDRVLIVHKGLIRGQGRIEDILAPAVETVDLQFSGLSRQGVEALEALSAGIEGMRVIARGGLTLVSAPGWDASDRATREAEAHGGRMVSMQPQRESLESYFLREIGEGG